MKMLAYFAQEAIKALVGIGSKACLHRAKHGFGEKTIAKEKNIREKLIETRVKYGAARAWLARFHNGGKYADGDHREYYSINDIVVDSGVSRPIGEPHYYSNIPIQLAYELLNPLFEKNELLMNPDEFTSGGYWYNMLTINQVEHIMVVLVRDTSRRYGFMGITWTTLKPLHGEPDMEFARNIATELSVMLRK
jgi:hypothetical protein